MSFFDNIEEGEEYVNLTCSVPLFLHIQSTYEIIDYQVNYVRKKMNIEDEELKSLFKEKSKISKQIQDRYNELKKDSTTTKN